MLKVVARATGVLGALFCVNACAAETETPLGSQSGLSAAQRGSVTCSSLYGSQVGGQMVDPTSECLAIHSNCSDGRIYEVRCDGLECVCLVDGWPERVGVKHHCPHIDEAAEMCQWPIRLPEGTGYGSGPVPGARCDTEGRQSSGCECDGGRWACPGLGGCNVLGAHVPLGSELPVVRFLPDNTFTVLAVSDVASVDQLVDASFYGTWVLQGDVLSVRSRHASGSRYASADAATCAEQPGRYTANFDQDCNLAELSLLDDPCAERHVLATELAPLK